MFTLFRRYLKGTALLCAMLAPFFMFLEVFMDLQQPAMMSDIVDVGIVNQDLSYVWHTGLKMTGCAFLGVIGGCGCTILSSYAAIHFGGTLRSRLFKKIQQLSFIEIDMLETSSLVIRMTNDAAQVQEMVSQLLRTMSRAPALCLGSVWMSFLLSPKLALIFCVVLPLLVLCSAYIMKKSIPMFAHMQTRMDHVNTIIRENLLGVRVIKTFLLEKLQFQRFLDANEQLYEISVQAQGTTFLLMPLVSLIMNLSVVAVLWFGGQMQIAQTLQAGKIMAFVNYMVQLTNALIMLVNFMSSISRAQASSKRIQEVLDVEVSLKETTDPKIPTSYDIVFDDVSFKYQNGEYVLRHINCTIPQGQRVGIIGGTGSGKSTFISLLPRLYEVKEGSIRIGNVNIKDIPTSFLRKHIGFVLQDSLLFSGTVAQNLRYGKKEANEEELEKALRFACADSFLKEKDGYLDACVEQRGKNFSGGQKQRLSIARTLLMEADILIFDDATSAIDLMTERTLQDGLQQTMKSKTFLMIAQRIASIMDCDTILVFDNGEVIAQGTHEHLLAHCELYRSIAQTQLPKEVLNNAG